jgi:hypothetical protein
VLGVTVAVKVTGLPKLEGFRFEATEVEEVSWLTVCARAEDVLAASLLSPP